MKTFYLKNVRKGFATNSSSTHSVIYQNKEKLLEDLDVLEQDFYDRFESTIAASKKAKIKYVAANIFWNKPLFDIMCAFYPSMKEYNPLIEKQKESDEYLFGMYYRGNLYFDNNKNLEASVEYLRNVIDNDDIVIVGGSDEMDFVYDIIEGHKEIEKPSSFEEAYKNGNYWVCYGHFGKVRLNNANTDCIPAYPELIDLCITKSCQHACQFCYMSATPDGKHADFELLRRIVNQLSSSNYDRYDKKVEFSIGGGNVLLYPQLDKLFEMMDEKGHIINTTINVKDCETLISDEKLFNLFSKYVKAIGVSVTDTNELERLRELRKKFEEARIWKQITLHLIPEYLGVEKTREILTAANNDFSILYLGYKSKGRGAKCKHSKLSDQDLTMIFKGFWHIAVDTSFANTYYDWLTKNYETDKTLTLNEGEYSMFIDAVNGNAYKSSYQLDKPYNLDFNLRKKAYYRVIDAFKHIREDNGFKNIE